MEEKEHSKEHAYIPPAEEDLFFKGGERGKGAKLTALIEKQRQGIELGIRPQMPRGSLPEYQWSRWRAQVWRPWLKKHPTPHVAESPAIHGTTAIDKKPH